MRMKPYYLLGGLALLSLPLYYLSLHSERATPDGVAGHEVAGGRRIGESPNAPNQTAPDAAGPRVPAGIARADDSPAGVTKITIRYADNKQPVEAATVSVISYTGNVLRGSVSDSNGECEVTVPLHDALLLVQGPQIADGIYPLDATASVVEVFASTTLNLIIDGTLNQKAIQDLALRLLLYREPSMHSFERARIALASEARRVSLRHALQAMALPAEGGQGALPAGDIRKLLDDMRAVRRASGRDEPYFLFQREPQGASQVIVDELPQGFHLAVLLEGTLAHSFSPPYKNDSDLEVLSQHADRRMSGTVPLERSTATIGVEISGLSKATVVLDEWSGQDSALLFCDIRCRIPGTNLDASTRSMTWGVEANVVDVDSNGIAVVNNITPGMKYISAVHYRRDLDCYFFLYGQREVPESVGRVDWGTLTCEGTQTVMLPYPNFIAPGSLGVPPSNWLGGAVTWEILASPYGPGSSLMFRVTSAEANPGVTIVGLASPTDRARVEKIPRGELPEGMSFSPGRRVWTTLRISEENLIPVDIQLATRAMRYPFVAELPEGMQLHGYAHDESTGVLHAVAIGRTGKNTWELYGNLSSGPKVVYVVGTGRGASLAFVSCPRLDGGRIDWNQPIAADSIYVTGGASGTYVEVFLDDCSSTQVLMALNIMEGERYPLPRQVCGKNTRIMCNGQEVR